MGWVVTSWRTERLEALLEARAHESARAIVAAAEREARRAARVAARETADAAAHLDALERQALETRVAVRAQRRAVRSTARSEVPAPAEGELRVVAVRRPRRASMRDSAVAELFRTTA